MTQKNKNAREQLGNFLLWFGWFFCFLYKGVAACKYLPILTPQSWGNGPKQPSALLLGVQPLCLFVAGFTVKDYCSLLSSVTFKLP